MWKLLCSSVVVLMLAGCVSPQDVFDYFDPPKVADAEIEEASVCGAVRASTVSWVPMRVVGIEWEANVEPEVVFGFIEQTQTAVLFERDEQGRWGVLAPLSPLLYEPMDVTVQVHLITQTAQVRCPAMQVTLGGIVRTNENMVAKLLDVQKQLMDVRARAVGLTIDDLRHKPLSALPVQLHGSAALLRQMESPGAHLPALQDVLGTTRHGLSEEALQVANDVLAHSQWLEQWTARLERYQMLVRQAKPFDVVVQQMSSPQAQTTCLTPRALTIQLTNAKQLSNAMRQANLSYQHINSTLFNVIGQYNNLAGVVPEPVTQGVTLVTGMFLLTDKIGHDSNANRLPSILFEPSMGQYTDVFLEDGPQRGQWSRYMVRAKSKGWHFDYVTRDVLLTSINVFRAVKSAKSVPGVKKVHSALSEMGGDVVNLFSQQVYTLATDELYKAQPKDKKICSIPPQKWGPFDLGSYTHSKNAHLGSIKVDHSAAFPHKSYTTQEYVRYGSIRVHAADDMFPPKANVARSMFEAQVDMPAISVSVEPPLAFLKPGQSIELVARVKFANDTGVRWEIVQGQGVALNVRDDRHAQLVVPSDYQGGRVVVRARSLSQLGNRLGKVDVEPRDGFGEYVIGKAPVLDVSPMEMCIKRGQTRRLNVSTYAGLGDLIWEVSDASGLKVVGGGEVTGLKDGVYTVTVSGTKQPDVRQTVRVRVHEACMCDWWARVSSPQSASFGGSKGVQATVYNNRLNIMMQDEANNTLNILVMGDGPSVLKARLPGEYLAIGSVSLAGEQSLPQSSLTLGQAPKLVITRWDGNVIEGWYEAHVTVLETATLPPAKQVHSRVEAHFSTYVFDGNDPSKWVGPNCGAY